jgi:hypothetical protein
VLAACNALIHSSAGLTVLEAIIRGCPVISYGFGYGHVRVSNQALERFKLAQVARNVEELQPAITRALAMKPAPDTSFAKRPSTAALILTSSRRTQPLPSWRVRTVRTVTAAAAATVVAAVAFTSSVAYSLASDFTGAKPLTAVTTPKRQVGVMVDASASDAPALARELERRGIRVSFALPAASSGSIDEVLDDGDELLPRLNDSGLVGWLHTGHHLKQLEQQLGWRNQFLYASSGPSLAQWLLAKHAGGRLVEGKVRLSKPGQMPDRVRAGEVIELRVTSLAEARHQLVELERNLREQHLRAVPVGTLLRGSGTPV